MAGVTRPPELPVPTLDRRNALRLAGGGALAVAALGAVTGCSKDEKPALPDPLLAQEESARVDAAAATAAISLAPERSVALQTVATQRTAHAAALRTEIDRLVGVYGDGTTPSHDAQPTTVAAPVVPPPVSQVHASLVRAQRSSAELSIQLSGYRSGLLASISAACATHAGVLLA